MNQETNPVAEKIRELEEKINLLQKRMEIEMDNHREDMAKISDRIREIEVEYGMAKIEQNSRKID